MFLLVSLLNIKLRGYVELVGNGSTVLLSLTDAFRKKIFDLPVHTAEIVLCPRGDGRVQLLRKS